MSALVVAFTRVKLVTCWVEAAVKVAVMFLLPVIVTASGLAVPVASPLQPVNWKPAAGVAVSVTTVPPG